MTRILIVGDAHGSIDYLNDIQAHVDTFECDKVFVVGDFGWFPQVRINPGFVKSTDYFEACEKVSVPIYFLDGNHEDHSSLIELTQTAEQDEDGFIKVWNNIFYSPRGHSWEWDGVKFLSLGGAYSIDRKYRTKYVSWWPEEVLTEEDVAKCMDVGKIDVLLSHDAPSSVDLAMEFGGDMGFWIEEETEKNRAKLQVVVDMLEPDILIHGHWHIGYQQRVQDLRVIGLNCNSRGSWFTVVDTEDWQ